MVLFSRARHSKALDVILGRPAKDEYIECGICFENVVWLGFPAPPSEATWQSTMQSHARSGRGANALECWRARASKEDIAALGFSGSLLEAVTMRFASAAFAAGGVSENSRHSPTRLLRQS